MATRVPFDPGNSLLTDSLAPRPHTTPVSVLYGVGLGSGTEISSLLLHRYLTWTLEFTIHSLRKSCTCMQKIGLITLLCTYMQLLCQRTMAPDHDSFVDGCLSCFLSDQDCSRITRHNLIPRPRSQTSFPDLIPRLHPVDYFQY